MRKVILSIVMVLMVVSSCTRDEIITNTTDSYNTIQYLLYQIKQGDSIVYVEGETIEVAGDTVFLEFPPVIITDTVYQSLDTVYVVADTIYSTSIDTVYVESEPIIVPCETEESTNTYRYNIKKLSTPYYSTLQGDYPMEDFINNVVDTLEVVIKDTKYGSTFDWYGGALFISYNDIYVKYFKVINTSSYPLEDCKLNSYSGSEFMYNKTNLSSVLKIVNNGNSILRYQGVQEQESTITSDENWDIGYEFIGEEGIYWEVIGKTQIN